ncbi:MAG: TIM barrel protein [Planctomycetaceae bacterium]|nr:TIM barrel protein [Planctomycetaceae bacterium]
MDFWQALDQIADLEFDKVEFWMDEEGSLKPSEVVANQDDFLLQLRDKTRLSPIAITLAQDVGEDVFEELCRIAKTLRVTQIVVPSSPVGTPFNSEIDRLKTLVDMAAIQGIRVGLRTQAQSLSGDAHTAVELCQSVKKLGIAFDPSYFLDERIEETVVDLVAPHTLHVHLRDSTQDKLQVQVGLGHIDYSRLVSQLERQRYNRALSVEILPGVGDIENRPLEMRKLRMLVDSLL